MADSVKMPGRRNVVPMRSFADTLINVAILPKIGERQFMSDDVDCLTQKREISI